uniref:Uncharacterized protein n=1 Tax=Strongyloides stercoralis TaxID=6248 RepID=A0A0K0DXQ2_STRER
MIDHFIFFGSLLLLRTICSFPLSDNINIIDSNEKIEFESKDENLLSVNFGKNNTIQDVEKNLDIIQENIEKSLNDDGDTIDVEVENDIISDIIIEPTSILSHFPNDDNDLNTNSSLHLINVTLESDKTSQISNNEKSLLNEIFPDVTFTNNITTPIVQTTHKNNIQKTIEKTLINNKDKSWWTKFMAGIRCALKDCSKLHEILDLNEEKNVKGIFEGSYMKKML